MTASPPETINPSASPVLELLVGNIASGKSSWTEPRASEGWITVNNDSLVRSMHGGNYDWERQIPGLKTSLGILIVETAGAHGRSVVIDNTNRTSSGRLPFVAAARRAGGMKVRAILFPRSSPETHARRRFEADARAMPHDYWLEVARLVDQEWAPPGDDEGDPIDGGDECTALGRFRLRDPCVFSSAPPRGSPLGRNASSDGKKEMGKNRHWL